MKISDSIKYSWIKTIRDKKNIINIILISISMLILIGILVFDYNFELYLDKSVNNNYGFRTLSVESLLDEEDRGMSLINKIEHVKDSYFSHYSSVTVDTELKTGKNNGVIELVYGSFIPEIQKYNLNNIDENVLVCPKYFFPSLEGYANKKNIINGDSLIDKNIKISYYIDFFNMDKELSDQDLEEKEFKVIGTYDNTKILSNNYQCYASYKNIKNIINTIDQTTNSISGIYVVVDEIKNIDFVKEELKKTGFKDIELAFTIDQNVISSITLIKKIIISITLVTLIIILLLNCKKKIQQESNIIGLFKAQGYSTKDILAIYIQEITYISLISLILSFFVFIFIYLLAKSTFLSFLFYLGVPMKLSSVSFFLPLVLTYIPTLIITILLLIYNQRKKTRHLVRKKLC